MRRLAFLAIASLAFIATSNPLNAHPVRHKDPHDEHDRRPRNTRNNVGGDYINDFHEDALDALGEGEDAFRGIGKPIGGK